MNEQINLFVPMLKSLNLRKNDGRLNEYQTELFKDFLKVENFIKIYQDKRNFTKDCHQT